jgi:hypothetical protein
VDAVFYKLLTTNDDSGRHGVLIPINAYSFFPSLPEPGQGVSNASEPFVTYWRQGGEWIRQAGRFVQYDRYPERRVTALRPDAVNVDEPLRLLLVGRLSGSTEYVCAVLTPKSGASFHACLAELRVEGLSVTPGGAAGIATPAALQGQALRSYDRLLERLREISARGWIATMRTGDTGIGFTLETLLGIEANVRRSGGDFEGIELRRPAAERPQPRVMPQMNA